MTVRQSGTLAELPPRHNSDGRSPKQGLGCRPTGDRPDNQPLRQTGSGEITLTVCSVLHRTDLNE